MFDEYSEEEIERILISYKRKKIKEKERYEKNKHSWDFKEKNKLRQKKYYEEHKYIKRQNYQDNKLLNQLIEEAEKGAKPVKTNKKPSEKRKKETK